MKIKNQFLLSIIIFILVIILFAAAVFNAQQQTTQLNSQTNLSQDTQTHASNLVYISSDYFLHHESSALTQWKTEYASLSDSLAKMSAPSPEQQTLLNKIKFDAQQLNKSWSIVAVYLETTPLNVTVRNIPEFQADWSIMSAQNQALIFDLSQQSQTLRTQIDQLNLTTILLIVALLGIFGAYFITNYLITYHNTLKSISELQTGIAVIGSGNLSYSLNAGRRDEIGDIAKSVNQMAANLKTVTASKTELELAQASLRESEQRWATTLSSIGDAVIATNTVGNVVFMNGVAEELTGWTLTEASGKLVKEIFNIVNEQSRLRVEDPVAKVLEKGVIVGLANHTVLIRKDGTDLPIDDSGAPIIDREGKITGVVLIFRDITEHKKAEEALKESEHKFKTLAENAPDAIMRFDSNQRVLYLNPADLAATGKSLEDFIGKTNEEMGMPIELCKLWNNMFDKAKISKQVQQVEFDFNTPTGVRTYNLRVVPEFAEDGSLISYMGISRDITERKKAEEALKLRTEQLEQTQVKLEEKATEVEEYASQMEQLAMARAQQLKDAERLAAIGATAGMVGHDIRNPLQAIIGDVYLTKQDVASLPENETKVSMQESLDAIQKNTDYINKIVMDLQDFARPLTPVAKEINVVVFIKEVLRTKNIPKNIKIIHHIQNDSNFLTDPDLLKRIIENLITNALQAMPNGGKLTIQTCKQQEDYIIRIEDTGVGIPDDLKPKLFTPMFTTKSKGQGFGLAVVKRMTEALGGTITFESEVGKGTKFVIRLPPPKEINGKFIYKKE